MVSGRWLRWRPDGYGAALAVPAWRHFARGATEASRSNPFLNRRNEALVGREFTLEKPIVDGSGTVRIDDTVWRVAGPDAPAGSRVKVVRADGAIMLGDKVGSIHRIGAVAQGSGACNGWTFWHIEQGGKLVASLDGNRVLLTDAKGGKASVTATDLAAGNGVVHVVDRVLMP